MSLSLRLAIPARPIRPVPSRPSVLGSGTTVTLPTLPESRLVFGPNTRLNFTVPVPGGKPTRLAVITAKPAGDMVIIPLVRVSVNSKTVPAAFRTLTVPPLNVHEPVAGLPMLQPADKVPIVLRAMRVELPKTLTVKVPAAKPPATVLLAVPLTNVPVLKLSVVASAAVGKAKAKSANIIPRLMLTPPANDFLPSVEK